MDSGSADFWVGAENCQSEGGSGCVRYFISSDIGRLKLGVVGKP